MGPGKMCNARMGPLQTNYLEFVMAMQPDKMAYCHMAYSQLDDPPYTLAMAHATVPDRMRYRQGGWWGADILAFATEMAHAMSPGKMK